MGENGDGVTVKTGHREVGYRPGRGERGRCNCKDWSQRVGYRPGGGERGRCNCKDWSQRGEVPARWGRTGTV